MFGKGHVYSGLRRVWEENGRRERLTGGGPHESALWDAGQSTHAFSGVSVQMQMRAQRAEARVAVFRRV